MKKIRFLASLLLCMCLLSALLIACNDTKSDETQTDAKTTTVTTPVSEGTTYGTDGETEPDESESGNDTETDKVPVGIGISKMSQITNASGVYYLTSDIGSAESPNSYTGTKFSGTLDGNGYTVTTSVPLFVNIDGATVKNLKIAGAITVTNDTVVGALSTMAKGYVTLEAVTNSADITLSPSAKCMIGGLIGSSSAGASLTGCANSGNISVTACAFEVNAGGMIGITTGGVDVVLTDCTNSGSVSSQSTHVTCLLGGMVGTLNTSAKSAFVSCTNSGIFSSVTKGGGYKIGGIVGVGSNTTGTYDFENCINNADLASRSMAGGIAADLRGTSAFAGCINNGSITVKRDDTESSINSFAAGICTQLYNCNGTFTQCANYGDITSTSGKAGTMYASGIVTIITNPLTATDCVNYGKITADNCASGIAGKYDGLTGTFTRCINFGEVKGPDAEGSASFIGLIRKENTVATDVIRLVDCYGVNTVAVAIGTRSAGSECKGNVEYSYTKDSYSATVIGGTDTTSAETSAELTAIYSAPYAAHGMFTLDSMKGDAAKTVLSAYDFVDVWATVDGNLPKLRIIK